MMKMFYTTLLSLLIASAIAQSMQDDVAIASLNTTGGSDSEKCLDVTGSKFVEGTPVIMLVEQQQ